MLKIPYLLVEEDKLFVDYLDGVLCAYSYLPIPPVIDRWIPTRVN